MSDKVYYGTGRRKTSKARVFLKPGKGKAEINGRPVEDQLKRKTSQLIMYQPLELIGQTKNFDIFVTVAGGGETGQAGAIRHGIARALVAYDANLKTQLKQAGFVTRDPRMVERKKYGVAGARRRYQYSKR